MPREKIVVVNGPCEKAQEEGGVRVRIDSFPKKRTTGSAHCPVGRVTVTAELTSTGAIAKCPGCRRTPGQQQRSYTG